MTGKTHVIGGVTASLAFAPLTANDPFIMLGAGAIGALLPDICHTRSKMGRMLPLLSKLISTLFGHRTFTHSLLFLVLINVLLNSFITHQAVTSGILIGMISHYVLDMATKNGIKLFFPFKLNVRFPLTVRTGSVGEKAVFAVLSLFAVYFGYGAFFGEIPS